MISGVIVLSFLMPLQISGGLASCPQIYKPVLVGAFVDSAKILGLPKFRLRDSNGNPYLPDKALLQEPLASIYKEAGVIISELELTRRKLYIQSYVKR